MIVSFCVVARNEEKNMPKLFDMIRSQDFPHEQMEIVLVDSMSEDGTKDQMLAFAKSEHDFREIQVVSNPKIRQAPGWNEAIEKSNGELILRVDAHASIPPDFVRQSISVINDGEFVAGGPRPNVADEPTPWKGTLLTAESSMFGSGIAPFRKNGERTYVKSVFHGIYRREVFEKAGVFDERLGRTEDNELHYRIRQAGYKICFDPAIHSFQHVRGSLRGMIKQKYGNGFWIGRTVGVCPGCLSLYHFVPGMFVLALLLTGILAASGFPILFWLLAGAYGICDVAMTIMAILQKKVWIGDLLLPIIFFLLHAAYGVGTIVGLIGMRKWRKNEYANYRS